MLNFSRIRMAVQPRVVLRVVVFVAQPRIKAAAAILGNRVKNGAAVLFLKAVEVPLAKPRRVITRSAKGLRNRQQLGRQAHLMTGHGPMWVAPREQRTAIRAAERAAGHSPIKDHAIGGQRVDIGCADIFIAHTAERLRTVLVAKDPDQIALFFHRHRPL